MKYFPDVLPFSVGKGILNDVIGVATSVHKSVDHPEWTEMNGPEKKAAKNKLSKILKPKEQLALYKWAEAGGHLLSNSDFTKAWKEDGSKGETENEAYYDEKSGAWLKRNDLSYHDTYLSFFQRVALHNKMFPEAPLTLIGFVVDKNRNLPDSPKILKPVFSQPHVEAERGAETAEVAKMMAEIGYEKVGENDYYNSEHHIRVEDLHNENVFFKNGEIYVIDPVIFLDDRGKQIRLRGSLNDITDNLSSDL
jgi:hypothetical protein